MSTIDLSPAAELLSSLRAIVGDRGLLTGDDVRSRSCDPFREIPPEGAAIVRPANTEELSAVMRLCHQRGQRVVTHGGRTGVAGGAYVGPDEIVVSLERMTRIEEIDAVNQVAVVQAGITVESLQNAVAEEGLFYPIDLGAKGTATIGGTISTNAGGNRVLRWGMTRQNLLGIEAVLADGTVVSAMNRLVKNNTGYDLKHLFAGSEGTLGIVTRAVLRLVAAPTSQSVAFVAVPGYEQVLALLTRARRLASLSAFEVMWQDYYALVAGSGTDRRPVAPDWPYYVLIESMGYDEETDQRLFGQLLEQSYEQGLIADAVTAASRKQVADLWHVREGSEAIVRAMSPFVSFDISVDVRRAEAFVEQVRGALGGLYPLLRTVCFGHLGDNNIHIGVHVGPDTKTEELAIERCVYDVVKDYGGALTAEHGIGRFKRDFLPEHKSPGEMDLMHRLRAALDPDRLLNRDVMF